jgi:D-beta-D-heptose 7-phosphate kinase/D-beta-D-heptose 1-phosphate adenosyltransferase
MSQIIQQLESYKVLVIGDYCTDIYKIGSIDRLCPEAPVPVFRYIRETSTDGMAGNVYNNLLSLHLTTDLIVGNRDIKKIRYIDNKTHYQVLREDYEPKVEPIQIDLKTIKQYDAIIVSDYDKGSVTRKLYEQIRNNFDKTLFVDSKKEDLSFFEGAIIKINENEMRRLKKRPLNSELIVTLGSKGASYRDIIYPTSQVNVFDASGAGDSFMAGLVASFLISKDIVRSIEFANMCATNVVKKPGTATIDFEEVSHGLCI